MADWPYLGDLVARLAHEIRNPLNGVQLHLTVLERALVRAGLNDPEANESVHVMRVEILRLSMLVSEFIDFARPTPMHKEKVALVELCGRALGAVASEARAADIQIQTDLPSSDIVLELDAAKVEQAIINLLRNAMDSVAPTGVGRVMLRAKQDVSRAVIEVEDNGPGIANPGEPIFDAFFSTKARGTGLGLPIVQRVARDHDGAVDYESRKGKTVFRISLPIQTANQESR